MSVVIASYRWPEALALSLESALAQTVGEIEVLVVEDGSDRASAAVVRAAGDRRARHLGLPRNSGSQSAPNTLGWRHARAPVVAYLGHDDLWHPEHLESLLATLADGADIAHALTIASGPPPQARLMLAGVERWQPHLFVPPSSLAHRRLSGRLGGWPAPGRSGWPVDHAFMMAAHARGATVAATGRPTAFKFPAAWRPDAYRSRDASLQMAWRTRLARDPAAGDELLAQARERGVPVFTAPPDAHPGEIADHLRRIKGQPARHGPRQTRWSAGDVLTFDGWFDTEVDQQGRPFRWTGRDQRAVLRLDAPARARVTVRIAVVNWLAPSQLADMQVDLDRTRATIARSDGPDGLPLITATAHRATPRPIVEIGLTVPRHRVQDHLPGSSDSRRLGIAVRYIEVLPRGRLFSREP